MPVPENGESWGILGGMFDPIHNGHLNLARNILSAKKLDGVLFVLSFNPTHRKEDIAVSFDDRLAMLELALRDYPKFAISDIERTMDLPGYTLNTVRELTKAYPDVSFRFLIGSDNLASFKTWYCWEQVLEEIPLLVGGRPGTVLQDTESLSPGRVELVDIELVDLSSSMVRRKIQAGLTQEELSEFVPSPVAAYIAEKGLYR
ncbi:MAG: nicotinate (nicotinamide) nucleotide adenylyltransferase [Candidatus Zixiibacteriota bacterium]|nr:MAG: nicotinate (nicotinamide) nucleotide adenylyltransferase [candidate division Zixibacteria bacterium]